VVISPNRNLSIVSDSLGRVILIDNLKGVAVRMWKGMWYYDIISFISAVPCYQTHYELHFVITIST
jgi:hypothetical protein